MSLIQAVGFTNEQTAASFNVAIAATGAGNALLLLLANYINTKTVSSFVAGALSSSAADNSVNNALGPNSRVSVFSIPNVAGGLTSVTINMSAAAFIAGMIVEESGLVSSAALDQTAGQNQSGTTDWTSGLTAETAQGSEVAYGLSLIPSTGNTLVPDAGWALLSGTGITSGCVTESTAALQLLGMRRALSAQGTYQASGTGPNSDYTSIIATYKAGTTGVNPGARAAMSGGFRGMSGRMR